MPKLTFFPLGNADSCLIEVQSGGNILFDFGNQRDPGNKDDKRCDLAAELRKILKAAKRDYFDVVAFTHLDRDHYDRATEFFYFDHIKKYQDKDRIKIREMWVPAAVIVEALPKDQEDIEEAKAIQKEARERLKAGKGIRVFSRPGSLKKWLEDNGLTLEKRKDLITDAGNLIPGWDKNSHGVEFFVHSPFAKHADDKTTIDRNTASLIVHATFYVGTSQTKLFLGSDATYDVLQDIVNITKAKGRTKKLEWDVLKLMHHCSYTALSDEKGKEKTTPVKEVKELFEEFGQQGGIIVSMSWPIPTKGSDEDESGQPPHRQAANYYKDDTIPAIDGEFIVTMEHPKVSAPAPLVIDISDNGGATVEKVVATGISVISSTSAPRAG